MTAPCGGRARVIALSLWPCRLGSCLPCVSCCLSSALDESAPVLWLWGSLRRWSCGHPVPSLGWPRLPIFRLQLHLWASQPAPDRCPSPSAQRSGECSLLPPVRKLPAHGLQRLDPEDSGPHGGPAALHAPWASGEGIRCRLEAHVGLEFTRGGPSLGAHWGRFLWSPHSLGSGARCRNRFAPHRTSDLWQKYWAWYRS